MDEGTLGNGKLHTVEEPKEMHVGERRRSVVLGAVKFRYRYYRNFHSESRLLTASLPVFLFSLNFIFFNLICK